jgi:poly-gamma-glutamate synthesis protein (capsule biosynthesis protein)
MKLVISVLLILLLMIPSALADDVSITISFAGDCTLGSQEYLRNSADSFDSFIKKYGTEYPLEKVRDLFLKDDWTVVNLECVLCDSAKGENNKRAPARLFG